MGTGSLVLGIIALVLSFIPGVDLFGVILGVVGIILGALARKNPDTKSIATAGLVCSIIAVVLGLIGYIACASAVGAVGCGASQLSNSLSSIQ